MKYYSQFGEDEFLAPLLPEKGWFVDVGAWDGKYLSNTFHFVEKGWDGLEIEADANRTLKMKKNLPNRIHRLNKKIEQEELDETIAMFPDIPKDFDLLSIDIDSYDYELWFYSSVYQPKFVVIEVGSWTTPEKMNQLAVDKGYKLIWDKANFIYQKI